MLFTMANGILFVMALITVFGILGSLHKVHSKFYLWFLLGGIPSVGFFYRFVPSSLSGRWRVVAMINFTYFLVAILVYIYVYAYITAEESKKKHSIIREFRAVLISATFAICWFPAALVLGLILLGKEVRWHTRSFIRREFQ